MSEWSLIIVLKPPIVMKWVCSMETSIAMLIPQPLFHTLFRGIDLSYALTSSRRYVGGQSHCFVHACDLRPRATGTFLTTAFTHNPSDPQARAPWDYDVICIRSMLIGRSKEQANMAWGPFQMSNCAPARLTRPIRILWNGIWKGDGGSALKYVVSALQTHLLRV